MTTIEVSFSIWNDTGNGNPRGIKCSGSGDLANATKFAKLGPYLHVKIPSNLVYPNGDTGSSLSSQNCVGWVLIAPKGGQAYYQVVDFCSWKVNSGQNDSEIIMRVSGYYSGFGPTTI